MNTFKILEICTLFQPIKSQIFCILTINVSYMLNICSLYILGMLARMMEFITFFVTQVSHMLYSYKQFI